MLLQTLVFVKGQCIGKRTVSYAQKTMEPDFSEQAMHELLKSQHKAVMEALRQGRLESVAGSESGIQDVGEGGLTLKWTNASEPVAGLSLAMSFEVLDGAAKASGAVVTVTAISPASAPTIASTETNAEGNAIIRLSLTEEMLRESAVMVRASHGAKCATRKFRFKK